MKSEETHFLWYLGVCGFMMLGFTVMTSSAEVTAETVGPNYTPGGDTTTTENTTHKMERQWFWNTEPLEAPNSRLVGFIFMTLMILMLTLVALGDLPTLFKQIYKGCRYLKKTYSSRVGAMPPCSSVSNITLASRRNKGRADDDIELCGGKAVSLTEVDDPTDKTEKAEKATEQDGASDLREKPKPK